MSVRFLSFSVLMAAGWLAIIPGLAPARTPDVNRCPAATSDQGKLLTKAYQVADLVVPDGGGDKAKAATREAELIKTIQDTIAPQSWAAHGGRGTIDYFPMKMTLVVNQTVDIQEQIADLLAAVRRDKGTEVVLEVRLVTLPAEYFEHVGIDFNVKLNGSTGEESPCITPVGTFPGKGLSTMGAFLTDKQAAELLKTIQGNPGATILQAPRLTMLNGQMGCFDCTEKQPFVTGCEVILRDGQPMIVPKTEDICTGFGMSACPKISADRRFVQVKLEIDQTDLVSTVVPLSPVTVQIKDDQGKPLPFTQFLQQPMVHSLRIEKTVTIPDGGTVAISGLKKVSEVRHECDPPVLSKIPYVNRFFKTIGYGRETQPFYLLVTPRIVVHEEEENRPPMDVAPSDSVRSCPYLSRDEAIRCAQAADTVAKEMAEEAEVPTAVPATRQTRVLAELLRAYDEACAAGQTKEATRFARAALTIDPTCFAKRHAR